MTLKASLEEFHAPFKAAVLKHVREILGEQE
jgi:hypothetical protein